MVKTGQLTVLARVFQSKPGKVHARFNYFEQLYVTLTYRPVKALTWSWRAIQFFAAINARGNHFFHFKPVSLLHLLVTARWLR